MAKKGGGKPPKGRAAAKQKAQRVSSGRSASLASTFMRSSRQTAEDDFGDDDDPRQQFRGFLQASSPHGNSRHAPPLPGANLRHQAISFVSAASSTTITSEVPDITQPFQELLVSSSAAAATSAGGDSGEDDVVEDMADASRRPRSPSAPALPWVVDLVGDPALAKGHEATARRRERRSSSSAVSGSSEEVVTFAGRKKVVVIDDAVLPQEKTALEDRAAAPASVNGGHRTMENISPSSSPAGRSQEGQGASAARQAPLEHSAPPPSTGRYIYQTGYATPSYFSHLPPLLEPTPLEERPLAQGWGSLPPASSKDYNPNAIWAPAPVNQRWKKGRPRPDLGPTQAELDEYDSSPPKENKVQFADASSPSHEKPRRVGDSIAALRAEVKALHPKKSKSPGSKPRRKRGRNANAHQFDSEDDDDDDDDGEAAYDDYMANIAAQLQEEECEWNAEMKATSEAAFKTTVKFTGPSLVVDGREIAEDEILDKKESSNADDVNWTDDDSSDSGLIGQDLDALSFDSEDEDHEEYTTRQQWEDDADLRQRKREAMSDEIIARIFAKQEELGLYGDEMVLDNGDWADASGDQSGFGDVAAARAGIGSFSFASLGTAGRTPRRAKRSPSHFPNASAMADTLDQYGDHGFDIMDFDRPSLRNTKKGHKGGMPAELEALSDDELKANMAQTWENDRSKKRLKKAEREELRAQGMLGSLAKKGKTDLSQKYALGMTTTQIHAELRDFLRNDGHNSIPFPPMDKHDRKNLHELSVVLGLNSKSVGSGRNRFPVLYKTSTTPAYDQAMFDRASKASLEGRVLRTFGKSRRKATRNGNTGLAARGGGGGVGAATIRNGEIVGAGAAEIGRNSFGRKMMEKMGWEKGMALGKEGEGRLEPIEQVMRAGRSGLGERR